MFSERHGLKKPRTEIQIDSMDQALRNRLWNVLDYHYWSHEGSPLLIYKRPWESEISSVMQSFLNKLWHHYYKEPIDKLSHKWSGVYKLIRTRFFECEWYEVYDFIEFIPNNFPDKKISKRFMKTCNSVLEAELSAYRFVGQEITKITSELEIAEIEEALESPFEPVNVHLGRALKLMSDKESPDYGNSIKEAISAVEAVCKIITNNDKATLGQALDLIETRMGLHGALKRAFDSLYGYTSNAEGIRHALLEESTLSFDDAKFMLVSCSSFINYLISKRAKSTS